jgi:outer membrane protein assembly factor BamB
VIDPTLSALLDSVGHENAIVVSADQELVLTEESLAETRAASQRLTRLVSEAAASGSVDARVLERLRTDIESSLLAAVKTIPAPAAASGGFEADFKTIDSLEWIEFAPASGPTVSLPPLVGIVVAAEPEDSEILVDGVVRGKGRYSGLFRAGTVLDVLVRREGFADHSMRIDTAETGGTEYTVRLKEVPGNKNEGGTGEYRSSDTDRPSPDAEQTAAIAIPAAASAAPAAPATPEASSAAPASASPTAAATTAQPAAGPTPVSTAGTPPTSGIAPEKGRAAKEPSPSPVQSSAASASQSTALPERIKVSAMPLSGALALSTDLLVATDRTGTVYAFSPAGTLIWSVTTANNPNTVSFPVVAGNRVIFSGSREIVILDAANGSVVHRRALGSDESHGSGRRCAMAGSLVIMPSDSRIQFLDSASGQIRSSVVIPDGTRMSPAVWKDRAVIASQTGTLYVMNPRGGSTEMILRTNASQPEILSPLIWNDLAILVGKRGVVVCVDLVQQRVVWERRLLEGLSYVTDPAASEIGVYILGSDRIFGLSWRDGSDIFPPIAGAGAPAAVIAGRLAYASVKGGMVLADPMTGKPLTTVPLAEDASDTAGTTGIAGTTRPVDIHGKIGIGTAAGTILIVNP